MGLRDKLRSRAVELIQEPTTGPPPVVGGSDEEVSLFELAYGKQESRRQDGVRILTSEEEIAAHLDNMNDAARAGWNAQMELARQRVPNDS